MKKTLRRTMRSALRAIPQDVRHAKALQASRRMFETKWWREARVVFVYLSTEFEIDTTPLVEAGWRSGKRVLAPRVDAAARAMDAVQIRSWSDCLPGFRGIIEPLGGEPHPVGGIDMIVVPGLAFDHRGYRLGQGGGVYDRFLARSGVRAQLCGFAFEEQVVPRIREEAHDQPVQVLVTDETQRVFL